MTTTTQTTTDPLGDWFRHIGTKLSDFRHIGTKLSDTDYEADIEAGIKAIAWARDMFQPAAEHHEPPNADAPTDAEVDAAALEFEQHEQFWYGDDDQPRCECGFRLEESLNGNPIPSLRMHQARAALVAAREVSGR